MTRAYHLPFPAPDETAIVLANGPSLRGVDLTRLPPYATFGMNAAYRHWERIGWRPTYYSCLDEVVGLSHSREIARLIESSSSGGTRLFLLRKNLIERLGNSAHSDQVVDFDALATSSRALGRKPVTTGSHTLIWALSLGFKTLFLLGADCNYVEIVDGAERVGESVLEITRHAANPNYFFDDYQRAGDRYNVPNIHGQTHLRSWRVAAAAAAEVGAQVYNLSPCSKIDSFDFADVDAFLACKAMRIIRVEEQAKLAVGSLSRSRPLA